MPTPIFPNSSYLMSIGASPNQEKSLQVTCQLQRIRTFFCKDLEEFEMAASVMKRITAIIGFQQDLSVSEYAKLIETSSSRKIPTRTLSPNCLPAEIGKVVDDLIFELIPPELEKVLILASGQIFSKLIEGFLELKPIS